MDTQRIIKSARRIQDNIAAIKWFEDVGRQIDPEDHSKFRIDFVPTMGAGYTGAEEAASFLEAMLRSGIKELIETAIVNCRNEIVFDQEQIRAQIDPKSALDSSDA